MMSEVADCDAAEMAGPGFEVDDGRSSIVTVAVLSLLRTCARARQLLWKLRAVGWEGGCGRETCGSAGERVCSNWANRGADWCDLRWHRRSRFLPGGLDRSCRRGARGRFSGSVVGQAASVGAARVCAAWKVWKVKGPGNSDAAGRIDLCRALSAIAGVLAGRGESWAGRGSVEKSAGQASHKKPGRPGKDRGREIDANNFEADGGATKSPAAQGGVGVHKPTRYDPVNGPKRTGVRSRVLMESPGPTREGGKA